jgi:hypothetical protein
MRILWRVAVMPKAVLVWSAPVKQEGHEILILAWRVGKEVIVGLNVALKGPFPLVGESELSWESEMSRNFWCDFTLNFFARNIKN